MLQIRELDTGTNITLFKDNGNKETFTITQTKDRGASVICYDVKRSDNSHGILKEFCPENSSSLIRNEKGYLIHQSGSENSSFKEQMKMYVDSYQLILDAVTKEDDLATIFPDVEIYYSPEEKNSDRTVYIWTKEPPRITFETFCKNIRNDHDSIAEDKLLRILKAILSLTECAGIIHCAGFIHRDIKPGNFGFLTRRSKIMEDSISLFDVDTVCSVFKAADLSDIGSPGFHEPELMYQPAENQTDIYSIGATLFHAIIVTEETSENGFFYNDELYDDIEELVYHSEIVKPVLKNVPNDFTELLVTVLKKSLCARRNRYLSCEDMSKDIDRAVKQIQPVVTNLQNNSARKGKWIYKTWSEQKQFGFTLASFLDDDEILKIENLLKAEERNDQICSKPQNAYILGIYYFAFKEERNHEKAEKYLKISADSGNEKAKKVYEYLCRSDEDKCNKKVIKKAIQNNCILTIHNRGINMASFGLFIKKHEGKKLLFKSADMGHVGSMYMLAASYINKSTLFGISYIQNISKHEANSSKIQKKILKYVLTGVDRDIKDFKLLYADMYRQGYCFDQNIDHAIMLYRNLIKEECYFAYIFLHDCYILKKDYEQALSALEELSNIENTDKSNRTLAIELLANHYYTGDIVTQNKIKAVRYHFKAIKIDESKKDDSAIVIRILGIEDEETKIELLKEAVILEVYDSSEELTRLKNGEKCNGTIERLENYIYKDKKNMARLSKHSFLVSIVAMQIILSLFKILTKLSIISKSKEDIIEFEKKLKLIKSNNLDLEEQIEVINEIMQFIRETTIYRKEEYYLNDGVLTLKGRIKSFSLYVYGQKFNNQIEKIIAGKRTILPKDCFRLFSCFNNCTEIDLSNADASKVTDMRNMFNDCTSLVSVNLSSFNVNSKPNIKTPTYGMFGNCPSIEEITLGKGFKEINADDLLLNGFGWINANNPSTIISGDSKYSVIKNEGENTYYRLSENEMLLRYQDNMTENFEAELHSRIDNKFNKCYGSEKDEKMKNIIKNHMHDLVNQMFTDSKKDSENQTTSESEINNNSKS